MATQVLSTESVGSAGLLSPDATDASTTMMQSMDIPQESTADEGEMSKLTMQFLERISDHPADDQPEYPTLFDDDESADDADDYNVARATSEEARVGAEEDPGYTDTRDEISEGISTAIAGETNEEVQNVGEEEDPVTIETTKESPVQAGGDAFEGNDENPPSVIETAEEVITEAVEDHVDSMIPDAVEANEEDPTSVIETTEAVPVKASQDQADSMIQDEGKENKEDTPALASQSIEGKYDDIVLETNDDTDIAETKDAGDANDATAIGNERTEDTREVAPAIETHKDTVATPGSVDVEISEIVSQNTDSVSGEDVFVVADDIKSHGVTAMDDRVANETVDEDSAVVGDADSASTKDAADGEEMEKSGEENVLSLEEFAHAFVFSFDEDNGVLSETDGQTFDEGDTYEGATYLEEETYLSDENDELKLIRDSYSLYKRVEETCIDPDASCYTNRKKDDFVDQACAAIDCFYWRLTSLFIKTKQSVQESAEKGKAVARENINSERWSAEIKEAQKAKEVLVKSFHQFTSIGYDTGASDGNTVGIKDSFSTASDDETPSNGPRDRNSEKLFDKDCKQFSNFAGMTSKEATHFFESAQPTVMDLHDKFITPCMPENAHGKRPSQNLSQWLNGVKSNVDQTKAMDSPLFLPHVETRRSGSAPWDESSRPEESKCDMSEPEKEICGSEERDTTIPRISSAQSSVSKEKSLDSSAGDQYDRGTDDCLIELKKKGSGDLTEASFKSSQSQQHEIKDPTIPAAENLDSTTVKAKKPKKQRFWRPGRSKKNESSPRVSSIILIKGDAIEATTPNEEFMKMIAVNTKKMRRKKRNSDNAAIASSFVLSTGGDTGCEVLF